MYFSRQEEGVSLLIDVNTFLLFKMTRKVCSCAKEDMASKGKSYRFDALK